MAELINKILDALISREAFISFLGAFFGAFFALCFFIIGEKWKAKKDWRKIVRKEHAYLERYFNDLVQSCDKNIGTYEYIEDQLKNKKSNFNILRSFPISEDITMRLKDLVFINNVYGFMLDVTSLNNDIGSFNQSVRIINDMVKKYMEDYFIKQGDKDEKIRFEKIISQNADLFLRQSKVLYNFLKLTREKVIVLASENRFLMEIEKKKFKKLLFIMKSVFNKNQRQEEIEKQKKELKKEFEDSYKKNKKELQDAGVIN